MRIRALVVGLGLVCRLLTPAFGDELSQGDLLARWGAYQAAAAHYHQALAGSPDPSLRLQLLCRLLALAEARGDLDQVYRLTEQLEPLAPAGSPERVRIELARAVTAYRLGQMGQAEAAFGRVKVLASASSTPLQGVALYMARSFDYFNRLVKTGQTTPDEFETAFKQALAPIQVMPADQVMEPLDMLTMAGWGREWIRTAVGQSQASFARDPALSGRWALSAGSMAALGRAALLARAISAKDPEAGYVATHYLLELADGYPFAKEAQNWVDDAVRSLTAGDKILAAVAPTLGNPDFVEQQILWARCRRAQARVQAWHGQKEAATESYRQADQAFAKAGLPLDQIDLNCELAYFALLNKTKGANQLARSRLNQALQASQTYQYQVGSFFALGGLGWVDYLEGQLAESETRLRKAISLLDEWINAAGTSGEGRRAIVARCQPLYELLTEVLIKQGKTSQALEIPQLAQGQINRAGLDLSQVKTRTPTSQARLQAVVRNREKTRELTAQVQSAQAQGDTARVQELNTQLAATRSEFYTSLESLRKQDPDYERLVTIRPSSFAKLQPLLPPGVLLVQYFPAESHLYLFCATREQLRILQAPLARTELNRQVGQLRRTLTAGETELDSAGRKLLEQLYATLIQPLGQDLAACQTLVIAPAGALYYLPFSALINPASGHFLVEDKPLAVLTALDVLELGHSSNRDYSSLLALGDPDGSLPAAKAEASEVGALFPRHEVLTGPEATKTRLAGAQGVKVLHLATHGVMNPRNAIDSYLLMAGSGAEARLTAGEIYGLDLKGTTLVTLSACQTALGDSPGADLSTLAQAFAVAGAPAVTASLWSVSDQSTRALMREFYSQLAGGADKAQALRQAQLALLKEPTTAHPFHWAAFELLGDWR